ncbi:hypothetical protein K435DRAFT_662838 [Dendrothele bispora CBS 962.96]|uniref:Integrase catalytic domain-containing protein n=1 Tax=Dendrothele bispora (strain CBS 962.96) TaxID=1314807 RepID=A0A4S8M5A5_DENBC|nr:hypothetical protein K435DRAFT_662838 [Dendrothele bispora CBS 962.96]
MVNASGSNGHDNGTRPDDNQLRDALFQYARENLTRTQRLARLASEFDYHIKETTLKSLNRQFGVPTSRKPPPRHLATGHILDQMGKDPQGRRGPSAIKARLAQDDIQIPRSTVRATMKCNAPPEQANNRQPGRRNKILRVPLTTHGVFYEVHADGHEKLGVQALDMGGVGMDIYGVVEKCSSRIMHMVVLPSSRNSNAVGHVYLDFVGVYGATAMRISVDGGTETSQMFGDHAALRQQFAPQYDFEVHPPWSSRKSVHNTRIEGTWTQWQDHSGRTVREEIVKGKDNGLYHPGSYVRRSLFLWVWPKVVQNEIDGFVQYRNQNRLRKQTAKSLPSGATPNMIFYSPECYGYNRWDVSVPKEALDALRSQIPISRKEAFRWVDDAFDLEAHVLYQSLGAPKLDTQTGWAVYESMLPALLEKFNENVPVIFL